MKIVVISGEDIAKARARYSRIISGVKKKGWEVVSINLSDKYSIAEKLTGSSLFPEEILYTIDDIKKVSITDLKWIGKNASKYEGSLLLFSGGKVPATTKNALTKDTKFENFDVPKILFIFLESFYPGNAKACLVLFEKLLKDNPIEVVILMLARHLRDMYWVIEGGKGMNLPSWRAGKLKSQASKFTKESLRDTISTLADIDIKSKTSAVDARFLLEILITEKLV